MGSTRVLRFLLAVSALSFSGRVVQAQRYWHDDQGRDAFRIDAWMPFLKGDGHKFFTGAMVPSASIRVGDGFRIEADLPIVRASQDFGGIAGTQSAVRIGNPYIGLRIGEDEKPVAGSLGLRLPIGQDPKDAAGQQAIAVGTIANFDDFEAYTPDVMTFRGTLEYRKVSAKNILFGVKGGPSLQTNISGDPTIDSEISLDYGGRVGYDGTGALATLALTGRYLLSVPRAPLTCPATGSCDAKTFDARSDHHLSGTLELRLASIRPRVTLRVPLDKARRDNDAGAILGVGVSIAH
jgi:hypothetical protein